VIENQVQFHRAFGALVMRPVEQRQAKCDGGRIQGNQLVMKAEAMAAAGRLTGQSIPQHKQQVTEDLPGAVFVGIRQSGTRGCPVQPQMAQFAFTGGQPTADFAQRVRPAHLTEQHGDELAPTGEPAGVPFGLGRDDRLLKLVPRKELE
jgi:hypothetical protein